MLGTLVWGFPTNVGKSPWTKRPRSRPENFPKLFNPWPTALNRPWSLLSWISRKLSIYFSVLFHQSLQPPRSIFGWMGWDGMGCAGSQKINFLWLKFELVSAGIPSPGLHYKCNEINSAGAQGQGLLERWSARKVIKNIYVWAKFQPLAVLVSYSVPFTHQAHLSSATPLLCATQNLLQLTTWLLENQSAPNIHKDLRTQRISRGKQYA